MNDLTIATSPPGPRRFHGLGVEADAYIFDDTNRACGVGNDDLALLERRLRALRPGIRRQTAAGADGSPPGP